MQVDDKLFIEVVRELDLYVEIMANLLTDNQLDHVSTIGSQLVGGGDVPSAVKLRDRWAITAGIRDRAAKLLTPNASLERAERSDDTQTGLKMNLFDFAATNARQQASEAQGGLSPIRSEPLLAVCRMCKAWDDVSKACSKDECPVEKLTVAAQRLLDAWDSKPHLAWQPENNSELLEKLRAALLPKADKAIRLNHETKVKVREGK